MGDYSSITCRDMFALGDVHGLHDVQLLQKLRAARRSVQHLPVMVNRRREGRQAPQFTLPILWQ